MKHGLKIYKSNTDSNKLIFSEFEKSFIFQTPLANKIDNNGVSGDTIGKSSLYQVFLSASETDTFLTGSLSSVNLSSVSYYANIPSLSAKYPTFTGYNIVDLGGSVYFSGMTSSVQVNLGALSARATGHFKFIITGPGGYVIFPQSSNSPYYIQSRSVPVTPTPTPTPVS